MGLDAIETVDAAGIDRDTGDIVLSILDSWTWEDEVAHLRALQAKIDAYFGFIESGQILEAHPDARGRCVRIDVISRSALPAGGVALIQRAQDVAADLGVRISQRTAPPSDIE